MSCYLPSTALEAFAGLGRGDASLVSGSRRQKSSQAGKAGLDGKCISISKIQI